MSTKHKRSSRRCVDVDANKHHNNYLMDRRQSAIDGVEYSACEDNTNNTSSNTSGAASVRNNNQRCCYQNRLIHTCTMLGMTLLIFSGAIHHSATAFVTRIAGRSLLKPSITSTIKDLEDGSSYHSKELTLLQSAATNSRSRMRITSKNRWHNNDNHQLSSSKLQMSSSDMEVQSSQNTDQSSFGGGGDDNDSNNDLKSSRSKNQKVKFGCLPRTLA